MFAADGLGAISSPLLGLIFFLWKDPVPFPPCRACPGSRNNVCFFHCPHYAGGRDRSCNCYLLPVHLPHISSGSEEIHIWDDMKQGFLYDPVRLRFPYTKNAEDSIEIFRDNNLVSLTGVEPAAFRLGGERSILLSYRDLNHKLDNDYNSFSP